MSEEQNAAPAETTTPPPEPPRTTPLGWDEVPPFSVQGTIDLVVDLLMPLQLVLLQRSEPCVQQADDDTALKLRALQGCCDALIVYALERGPSAEVLFNKARELGLVTGGFHDLLPSARISFELAARLIPAIGEVVATINAEIVAKNPPPVPAVTTRPIDIEDTIFEQTDGIGELDEQRAAAQAKADEAAAAHAAKKKPAKKKRSIADAAD